LTVLVDYLFFSIQETNDDDLSDDDDDDVRASFSRRGFNKERAKVCAEKNV
jgi:hypothetical protein